VYSEDRKVAALPTNTRHPRRMSAYYPLLTSVALIRLQPETDSRSRLKSSPKEHACLRPL
jgi:hypothetical protein